MMQKLLFILILILFTSLQVFAAEHSTRPDEALKLLKEGNARYVSMEFERPHISKEILNELAKGQHPFAVIIACSDSRVPLEHIFDAGLGDLFEIKNAGNLIDNHVIGSVEYAVSHLGTKLVIVMGHTSCGCITTAIEHPKHQTRQVNSLLDSVKPAIELAKNQRGDFNLNVTKNNAVLGAQSLVKDKIISSYVKEHGVVIIPALYDIKTGKVEFYTRDKISARNIK
jgi:carbonic anhydrase